METGPFAWKHLKNGRFRGKPPSMRTWKIRRSWPVADSPDHQM